MNPAESKARIEELEILCLDVFTAGVELGLPQALLERLWRVRGTGGGPRAFTVDGAHPRHAQHFSGDLDVPARPELKPLVMRCTVLVVDDDPLMIELLVKILRRENFELLTARDGAEALQKADAHAGTIDLLLTDCEMPVMKGPELAKEMRTRYPGVKVLYQTGFSDMLFEAQPVLDETSSFLEKPFSARGIREAARMALFGALNPPCR